MEYLHVMEFFLIMKAQEGETFITRKITRGLTRINEGIDKCLFVGNLDAKRDWGHAKDYVEMQWLMLQQDNPDDFVISTGRMESVRKFVEICSLKLNWNLNDNGPGILWEGEGTNEIGIRADTKEVVIRVNKKYFRPTEVDELLGDSGKAFRKLGWKPKISLENLIEDMICSDTKEAKKEFLLKKEGFPIESRSE